MQHLVPVLFVLFPRDPHLLKRGERRDYRPTQPAGQLAICRLKQHNLVAMTPSLPSWSSAKFSSSSG